jgi:limonene-1,2-epoxide hydrolase
MDTPYLNRRAFLVAGAALSSAAVTAEPAAAQEASLSDAEKANEDVVNDFCAAWESMDAEKLAGYWDDNITFRMIDTSPRVDGRDNLHAAVRQFLDGVVAARFEMLRSHVIGNVVINERIDHFDRGDKKDAFHVTGFFLVKNGKIVEWQDYMMPRG